MVDFFCSGRGAGSGAGGRFCPIILWAFGPWTSLLYNSSGMFIEHYLVAIADYYVQDASRALPNPLSVAVNTAHIPDNSTSPRPDN